MRMPQRERALPILALILSGCGPQEPAAAPLAAPPPAETPSAALAPPTAPEPAPAPPPAPELTTPQLVELYQSCWASLNAKDLSKLQGCYADNATAEIVDSGAPAAQGKEIVEKQTKPLVQAFPDLVGEAQLTLANGNNVVGIWLVKGTHQAPLSLPQGELAPTNKRVGYLMAQWVEFQGGKAAKELAFQDSRTFLGQLGVVPGPVRKPVETGAADKPVVVASGTPAETENLETYKKFIDAFNKHDLKELEPLLADDYVYSDQSSPADLVGKKEAQRGIKELWKAFSDIRVEPKSVWSAGDYVVANSTFTGTNDGPIPTMKLWKKTGKNVSLNVLEVAKIEGGKLKQHWVFGNGMAFATQLGVAPPLKDVKPAAVSTAPAAGAPAADAKTSAAASAAPQAAPATPAATQQAPSTAKPAEPAKPTAPAASPAPAK